MILLKIHHVHDAGYCSRGAREWCQRHGVNYTEFILHGIPVERIEAFGDAFCIHVCQVARAEYAEQNQEVSDGSRTRSR